MYIPGPEAGVTGRILDVFDRGMVYTTPGLTGWPFLKVGKEFVSGISRAD